MNTDILLILAFFAGMLGLAALVAQVSSWLFRLIDRTHPLAWIPALGLLIMLPTFYALLIG